MSVEEYYQSLGVVHTEDCQICPAEPKAYKALSQHIRFWLVIDTVLLVTAVLGAYTYAMHVIYSVVGT
jgi:hypothetical protein